MLGPVKTAAICTWKSGWMVTQQQGRFFPWNSTLNICLPRCGAALLIDMLSVQSMGPASMSKQRDPMIFELWEAIKVFFERPILWRINHLFTSDSQFRTAGDGPWIHLRRSVCKNVGGTSWIPNIVDAQSLGTDLVRLRDVWWMFWESNVGLYWEIYGFGDHELKGFGKNYIWILLWLLVASTGVHSFCWFLSSTLQVLFAFAEKI